VEECAPDETSCGERDENQYDPFEEVLAEEQREDADPGRQADAEGRDENRFERRHLYDWTWTLLSEYLRGAPAEKGPVLREVVVPTAEDGPVDHVRQQRDHQ